MRIDPISAWSAWRPDEREPWNLMRAAHLMRRAGFSSSPDQLDVMVQDGFDVSVDRLFACDGAKVFDESMESTEQVLSSAQDPNALASWWLLRMVKSPTPFLEKMTLFWHGHFATGAEKVADSRSMLRQNRLLRDHALGKFEPMVQGISQDVAMLVYLDSTDNRKTRPNENYARELMELFCLGPGNYSEDDIKELARCFTGWEVRRNEFRFNKNQHDQGEKTVLGKNGKFDGDEGVRIVIDHPATSDFIARKLINFFVTDDVVDGPFCEPVAKTLRESDFDFSIAMRQILSSKYFWSSQCIGKKVRNPVEMAIGLIRGLGINFNMNELRDRLAALGHLPLFPPNVKGWEGGRHWINASTFIGRVNLVRQLVSGAPATFEAGSLAKAVGTRDGQQSGDWLPRLLDGFLPIPLQPSSLSSLTAIADRNGDGQDQRIADMITTLAGMPEFHLN